MFSPNQRKKAKYGKEFDWDQDFLPIHPPKRLPSPPEKHKKSTLWLLAKQICPLSAKPKAPATAATAWRPLPRAGKSFYTECPIDPNSARTWKRMWTAIFLGWYNLISLLLVPCPVPLLHAFLLFWQDLVQIWRPWPLDMGKSHANGKDTLLHRQNVWIASLSSQSLRLYAWKSQVEKQGLQAIRSWKIQNLSNPVKDCMNKWKTANTIQSALPRRLLRVYAG